MQPSLLCDTVHACIMGPAAAGDGEAAERHGHGRARAHALLEEALAPSLALDPLRVGGGCDHQERRDHAAREGDHLQRGVQFILVRSSACTNMQKFCQIGLLNETL